jgi:hypothetical protein
MSDRETAISTNLFHGVPFPLRERIAATEQFAKSSREIVDSRITMFFKA